MWRVTSSEFVQVEGGAVHTFAVNVVWDSTSESGEGASSLAEALESVQNLLSHVSDVMPTDAASVPNVQVKAETALPDRRAWGDLLDTCLRRLHSENDTCGDGKGCDGACTRLDDVTEQALKV
jgi:hypothetical protein